MADSAERVAKKDRAVARVARAAKSESLRNRSGHSVVGWARVAAVQGVEIRC